MDERRVTRKGALFGLGGLLAAAAAGKWKEDAFGASAGPVGIASGEITCVLTPEQTEGPYYVPSAPSRRNIRAGKPGRALTLRLRVLDVATCRPIRGATVDIWHCDASGAYSGVNGDSSKFLRGVQKTDARGYAVFTTVYPGWYPGRTVHIHVKVHVRGNVVHTGQLYFPDAVTDRVYRGAPYNQRPGRSPRNPGDAIYRNGGRRSLLTLRRAGSAYVGAITMGVQR